MQVFKSKVDWWLGLPLIYPIFFSIITIMDRIRINYNKYDEIFISPKEKQHFINQLLEINPDIQVSI